VHDAPVQTGPGAHPASYTIGTESFPGVKRPGRDVDHPPPTSKIKAVPKQARCGPEGSRSFRLPDFHDIRHVKVVRSSASRTVRLYPRNVRGTHFH
jgi:hypothetical protein